MVKRSTSDSLLGRLLWLSCVSVPTSVCSQGVPGMMQTESGYDNPSGRASLCWASRGRHGDDDETTATTVPSPPYTHEASANILAQAHRFGTEQVELLDNCPNETFIHMDLLDADQGAETFPNHQSTRRTGQENTFRIQGSVNLDTVRQRLGLSPQSWFVGNHSDGSANEMAAIAIRIVFCQNVGSVCSPFSTLSASNSSSVWNNHTIHHLFQNKQDLDDSHVAQATTYKILWLETGTQGKSIVPFQTDVHVAVHWPGSYLPLASAHFLLMDSHLQRIVKIDIANLMEQERVFEIKSRPTILAFRRYTDILAVIIIGTSLTVQGFLLWKTFQHRKESVLQLSQAAFLILLQAAAMFATASAVLYRSSTDMECYLQGPFTLIPAQLMLAIVFGRMRRIIVIMKPLLNWAKEPKKASGGLDAWKSAIASTNPSKQKRRKSIRQEFTEKQLCNIIFCITLPAILIEVIALTFFLPRRTLHLDDTGMVGRYECGDARERTFFFCSNLLLFATLLLALREAM
eukprot:scaffold41002_cov290-Amphora_coffeaeformis.AAC.1